MSALVGDVEAGPGLFQRFDHVAAHLCDAAEQHPCCRGRGARCRCRRSPRPPSARHRGSACRRSARRRRSGPRGWSRRWREHKSDIGRGKVAVDLAELEGLVAKSKNAAGSRSRRIRSASIVVHDGWALAGSRPEVTTPARPSARRRRGWCGGRRAPRCGQSAGRGALSRGCPT